MPASSSSPANPPPFLLLGQVLRPHGVRGELRVSVLTAYPERIGVGMQVYLGIDPEVPKNAVSYEITGVRWHQQYMILQLETIEDRTAADRLRSQYVMVALDEAVPLEEGEFYLYQAIGLTVLTVDGVVLGTVVDVIETGANDVYVVQGPRGEILLPDIDECVIEVDLEAGTMKVEVMDGLLDD